MTNKHRIPTYRLRFFFDYGSGGCLWSDNEAAYQKFDSGPLDAEIRLGLDGKEIQEARIILPKDIKERVIELDKLYSESLDWNNPGGPSLWNDEQWNNFHLQSKQLYNEISDYLGEEFELLYKQE